MIPYHTPAELREFSNIGHVVEGILLAAVALLALAHALGYERSGRARYGAPMLLIVAGLFLPAMIVVHPTFEITRTHAAIILADPQQQQHLLMALLLLGSGVAEAVAVRRNAPALRIVWPVSLIIIGILFLIHPQHGTGEAARTATRMHQGIGILVIVSGAIRALALARPRIRWLQWMWTVPLLGAALTLGFYREPPGAYAQMPAAHATPDDGTDPLRGR